MWGGGVKTVALRGAKVDGGWPMGSDPTAAGGGRREGSEWQRSARDDGASAPRIFAGHRNRTIPTGCGIGLTD